MEGTDGAASDGGGSDGGGQTSTGTDVPAEECTPDIPGVRGLFERHCTTDTCHDAVMPAAALDLQSDGVETRLVDVPSSLCMGGEYRVVPGDAAASLLFTKLTGAASCGMRMPLGMPPLPLAEYACVRDWIDGLPPSSGCEMCGGSTCIDPLTDAANCGGCGQACPPSIGCVDGSCACPAGTEVCGDACVDTQSDPTHCGGCDVVCGAGEFCNAGACGNDCGALVVCGSACVDTATNPLHCGGCDSPCGVGTTCEGGTCVCGSGTVSFSSDVAPLLSANCSAMGCHGGRRPAEGLNLQAVTHDDLVGVLASQCSDGRQLVAAGDPQNSYVLDKLLGVDLCSGTRMPKASPPLSASDTQRIADWICQGAPDN